MLRDELLKKVKVCRDAISTFDNGGIRDRPVRVLETCTKILVAIELMTQDGRGYEANRLLGNVQGCLFSTGLFSLADLDLPASCQ